MNPIPISWCLGGAGAAALLGALAGWTVRDWKRDSEVLAEVARTAKQLDKARQAVDTAAAAYEEDRTHAGAQAAAREITIRQAFGSAPADVRCDPPAVVHGVLDDAVRAANARAAGEPAAGLPTAPATTGAAD